jgi:hypothetical protein
MSTSTTTDNNDGDNNGGGGGGGEKKKSIMEKLLTPNSKPTVESFPELPECIIWMRFIMAVCYGCWLVTSPSGRLRGGSNILLGLNFVTFVPVLYCTTYLGAVQESFGTSLMFGGVLQSLSVVLLIWIYFYTESHPDDVAIFAKAMMDSKAGSDWSAPVGVSEDSPIVEDSEF